LIAGSSLFAMSLALCDEKLIIFVTTRKKGARNGLKDFKKHVELLKNDMSSSVTDIPSEAPPEVAAEASIVLKAKHVRCNRAKLGHAKPIIGRNFVFSVSFWQQSLGSCALVVQLPRCQLFSGVYESDGKFYCDFLTPADGIVHEMYYGLGQEFERQAKQDTRFADVRFLGHVNNAEKTEMGHGHVRIRMKMPQNKAQITTKLFRLEDRTALALNSFVAGIQIVPVVAIDYVYVVNGILGFNLLLKEAAVVSKTN